MTVMPSRRTVLQVAATGAAVAAVPLGVREVVTPPAASAAGTPGSERVVTSVCEMCTVRCPILVRVRDGKVVRIEGNPTEKSTQGAICAKGNAGVSLLYDKDRVRTPLIRVGKRGEMLNGVSGIVVHDFYKSYYLLEDVEHVLCGAHLRRGPEIGESGFGMERCCDS